MSIPMLDLLASKTAWALPPSIRMASSSSSLSAVSSFLFLVQLDTPGENRAFSGTILISFREV